MNLLASIIQCNTFITIGVPPEEATVVLIEEVDDEITNAA